MESAHILPQSMQVLISKVSAALPDNPRWVKTFENCFTNTLFTTIKRKDDGTTFVITGDIPAMWLRDSAAQVRTYLLLAETDPDMADLIGGVVKRQFAYILQDPYANAFNEEPNGKGHQRDNTDMKPIIWERKYEIDSLCYPIQLAYLLWKAAGRIDHFDKNFEKAARLIIQVWKTEQNHGTDSQYTFRRSNCPETDTLTREGKGSPVSFTGMTWSGFRPSDDSCIYGYLIPANMFAVVSLNYLSEIAAEVLRDKELADSAVELANEIDGGIRKNALVKDPEFGDIYAYETDGNGNYNLMDDANVPSLLSIPYLGYCRFDDPIYLNTRRFVLSESNPYFYKGSVAQGIGSPHTPKRYIWHISLAIQGLTSTDREEKRRILDLMTNTDNGAYCMHEGFDVDDPSRFTRPWFSWANMMFCELLLDYCGLRVKGSPLAKA